MATDPNEDGRRKKGLLSASMKIVEDSPATPPEGASPAEKVAASAPKAPAHAAAPATARPDAVLPDAATASDQEARVEPTVPGDLPSAVRFTSAAATLTFAAQLIRLGRDAEARYFRDPDRQHWWVGVGLPVGLSRELAELSHGELYIEVDGRLVPDPAWGPPPPPGLASVPGPDAPTTLSALISVAGLHDIPARAVREVVVIAPAARVADLAQRALDYGLEVRYRLVSLSPLFGPSDEAGQLRIRVELCVDAGADRHGTDRRLPSALLGSWQRDNDLLLCRRAGTGLLMQYQKASPLDDRHLAALVDNDTWVLADSPHECARLLSDDLWADAVGLVRVDGDRPLVDTRPDPGAPNYASWHDSNSAPTDWPAPIPVRIRRARTPQASVDAVMLASSDLSLLPPLIQGHELSDNALLAIGRSRHLLIAPGGLLEFIPLGTLLCCVGPGPLYMPLGFRIWPQLPPSARRALFKQNEHMAVVMMEDATYEFGLAKLRPVWQLWAGPLPSVDAEADRATSAALAALDAAPDRGGLVSAMRGRLSQVSGAQDDQAEGNWRGRALDAELRGELVSAAEMHEQHGDHLRAAHLYERAGREQLPAQETSS